MLSARIRRTLIGRRRKFGGLGIIKYRAWQLVEDGDMGVLAFAAAVGEQDRAVALPTGPRADKARLSIGRIGVEAPLCN